jgi:CRP-like cAMP-binding protein
MDPRANRLIAALPALSFQQLAPLLEPVQMCLGDVLHEPGQTPSHVYFPTTSIVSLLHLLENGAETEIAAVGNEGIVGVSLFMGGQSTLSHAVVLSSGGGFRLPAMTMVKAFDQGGPLVHIMLRYTLALYAHIGQIGVCNRHHKLEQQLCRWLLLSLDRRVSRELVVTHELIANMLGVRRSGVTQAALALQQAGLIRYTRGHISVLDRPGLERRSCECYALVKKEYDRLFEDKPAAQFHALPSDRGIIRAQPAPAKRSR